MTVCGPTGPFIFSPRPPSAPPAQPRMRPPTHTARCSGASPELSRDLIPLRDPCGSVAATSAILSLASATHVGGAAASPRHQQKEPPPGPCLPPPRTHPRQRDFLQQTLAEGSERARPPLYPTPWQPSPCHGQDQAQVLWGFTQNWWVRGTLISGGPLLSQCPLTEREGHLRVGSDPGLGEPLLLG